MSGEYGRIVHEGYAAWNRDGLEAILDYLHPEIEWAQDPAFPDATTYHGHDGVRRWAEAIGMSFAVMRVEIDELHEEGDDVLAVVRLVTQGRGSGIAQTTRLSQLWSFREGKAARVRFYLDPDEGLRKLRSG